MTLKPDRVAILPWGGVIEDFLAPLGLSLHDFAQEMSGGWLFGYADAMRLGGLDPCILVFSCEISAPTRLVNPTTGVVTLALPTSPVYRALRRWPGEPDDPANAMRHGWRGGRELVRYAATPPRALARMLHDARCGIVLCQEYEYPRFDIAVAVASRIGARVFASFQGAPPTTGAIPRRLRQLTMRAAQGFIVADGAEADRIITTYGVDPARVARIPNPLDCEFWRPESRASARTALDLPKTARIAICHGRIDWHRKGIDVLLAAWRQLVARWPDEDLRLHLIGSGPDDDRLAAALARDPVRGLRWLRSYVTDRVAMRRELNAADLYVMASRHEGSPVAPLEAMACGLPVILSDAPGTFEILSGGTDSGGMVLPRGDTGALASALGELLFADERRTDLGAAARARVLAHAAVPIVGARLQCALRSYHPTRASG